MRRRFRGTAYQTIKHPNWPYGKTALSHPTNAARIVAGVLLEFVLSAGSALALGHPKMYL
jgi:hypothetical protein